MLELVKERARMKQTGGLSIVPGRMLPVSDYQTTIFRNCRFNDPIFFGGKTLKRSAEMGPV